MKICIGQDSEQKIFCPGVAWGPVQWHMEVLVCQSMEALQKKQKAALLGSYGDFMID